MKKTTRLYIMLAVALACSVHAHAGSGAPDRSKAFGYAFTQEELDSFPQITNIPTVYLQVYKTTYDASTDATTFTDGTLESLGTIFGNKNEWYYKTKIVVRDDNGTIKERNEWLGVRGRGNATWNMGNYSDTQKKPLRLKFPAKTDLLATMENGSQVNHFANAKSWTLLANYYDATMIHNAMAYEVGKKLGLAFCPAYKFVDLVVNGQYKGTYQISDHVQVGTGRVEIDETTGYFVEVCSSNFKEDPWINVANMEIVNVKSPEPDIVGNDNSATTDPKYDDLKAHLDKVSNLAWNGPYNAPINWRTYVDVETAAKVFIAQELLGNYDAGQGNNYAYMNDLESKIFFGPLWDFDLALNNKVNGKDMSSNHFWGGSGAAFAIFCSDLYLNDPYFVKAIYEEWQKINGNGELAAYLKGKADEIAQSIAASAALNYTGTASGGAGQSLNKDGWVDSNSYASLAAAYSSLNSFIDSHVSFLNSEFAAQYESMGCASLPEIAIPEGLVDLGNTTLWSSTAHHYAFYGNKNNMVKNAQLTIVATQRFNAFGSDPYTSWKSNNNPGTVTYTLTEEDVAMLKSNGYMFDIYVWEGGECSSVTLTVPACAVHDYAGCSYGKQADGSYRRICNVCSQEETDGEAYYLFTVYAESNTANEMYATSWAPDSDRPNSIAFVTVDASIASAIVGHNIVVNGVCADFRLTDGHPYCSGSKFTATTATYSRNVANDWGTIILPYKYQQSTTETASFYHLKSVDNDANGQKCFVLESIDPDTDGNASAYTPVFFKRANEQVSTVTVTGENITVKKSSADKTNSTVDTWTLVGTMEPLSFNVNDEAYHGKAVYYVANNTFWHATGSMTVNPFRAYVENASSTEGTANAISIKVDGEDVDVIGQLNARTAMALCTEKGGIRVTVPQDMLVEVYNAGGALISRASVRAGETFSAQLPAGVYTVNGVKVLVK